MSSLDIDQCDFAELRAIWDKANTNLVDDKKELYTYMKDLAVYIAKSFSIK